MPENPAEDPVEAIRRRAGDAIRGPWIWAGNTETGQVSLATADRGRIFILRPHAEKVARWHTHDGDGPITDSEYAALAPRDRDRYERFVSVDSDLLFAGRGGGGDRERFGGRMVSFREIARYDVLDGATREEAGLSPDAGPRNSRLYREDFLALDSPEAEFIAHARDDVDTLLAEVDRLRAELAALKPAG